MSKCWKTHEITGSAYGVSSSLCYHGRNTSNGKKEELMMATDVTAKDAARDVLQSHWVDEDRKVAFPVDTVSIATAMGVFVAVADLEPRQRGIAVRKESGAPVEFLLNSSANEDDLRYACARLLALTYDRIDSDEPIGFIDNDDRRRNTPYMDEFAAELMMPGTAVRSWWGKGFSVNKMAKNFGVSNTKMLNRLIDLGLAG